MTMYHYIRELEWTFLIDIIFANIKAYFIEGIKWSNNNIKIFAIFKLDNVVFNVQALQQDKHVLQRKLEMNELTSGQKEAELTADLAALRTELERYHSQGQDRRRDESEQLTQLANHNQRLVEQLAEVSLHKTA